MVENAPFAPEEILEQVFLMEEEGLPPAREGLIRRLKLADPEQALAGAVAAGLIASPATADRPLALTDAGRIRARLIVRRHRLAERLLHDVLAVSSSSYESSACDFEHVLDDEVTRGICTLLGHPAQCPHGKPIPPGDCCARGETTVAPLILPLAELKVGEEARVAYIATRDHHRLDRLGALGVLPGTRLRLHQRRPAFIIFLGETQLALDREVAGEIFVRRPQIGD